MYNIFCVQVGGPSWKVKLGRRDSTTASLAKAQRDLPLFTDNAETLIKRFSKKGLNARDMVALSGQRIYWEIKAFEQRL